MRFIEGDVIWANSHPKGVLQGVIASLQLGHVVSVKVRYLAGLSSKQVAKGPWNLRCEFPGVVQKQVIVLSAEDDSMTQGDIVGDSCTFAHSR